MYRNRKSINTSTHLVPSGLGEALKHLLGSDLDLNLGPLTDSYLPYQNSKQKRKKASAKQSGKAIKSRGQ
ncbi:hypothetical protein PoB_006860900 [Plakobranchus ocellatus]|uniref:Uncharacterized protein n=1 Tax=Plakobranchus ocellatus TaxID=259542 RepID=A0AAV4DDA0_9GAST|nr:hypothetical protein PoB_006860900 [Plakobranchus ocellatus]